MSAVTITTVILALLSGCSHGYLEMTPVLQMLNVRWEGECPVSPTLRRHPELLDLGFTGRCPTVYRILELPQSSEPDAILEGFCDPACHNTACGPLGNYRCRNYTVPVDISSVQFTDLGVSKVVTTRNIPVGCVCQFRRSTMLRSHTPYTVD